MKVLKLTISSLLIFILSYGVSNAQRVEVLGAARNECVVGGGATGSSLYRVNPNNANAVLIGDIGFEGVTGLAFLPDGRLVGSARADTDADDIAILIEVNPETGAGSLIGTIGNDNEGECGRAPDLSVDPLTGTLFATGNDCPDNNDFLQTVNSATGLGTLIGTYDPFTGGGNGLAISNNNVFCVTVSVGDFATLIAVDPNSGAPTLHATLTLDEFVFVNALDFHPFNGELFGSTVDLNDSPNERSSTLITINTVTGQTTEIGALPDCFDAIIFRELPANVPTLSEWGLIAMAGVLGIVGFMVMRRRKATA